MKIVSNPYAMVANITEIGKMATERLEEAAESWMDDVIEDIEMSRPSKRRMKKQEMDLEEAKLQIKIDKMKAKVEALRVAQNLPRNTEG